MLVPHTKTAKEAESPQQASACSREPATGPAIEKLKEYGFEEEACRKALVETKGDMNQAASKLFETQLEDKQPVEDPPESSSSKETAEQPSNGKAEINMLQAGESSTDDHSPLNEDCQSTSYHSNLHEDSKFAEYRALPGFQLHLCIKSDRMISLHKSYCF